MDIKFLVHLGVEVVIVGVFCYILYQFYKKINKMKLEMNRLRNESFQLKTSNPSGRQFSNKVLSDSQKLPVRRRSPRRLVRVSKPNFSVPQPSRSQFKNEETSSDSEDESQQNLNLEKELSEELQELQEGDSSSDTSESEEEDKN